MCYLSTRIRVAVFNKKNFKKCFSWFVWNSRRSRRNYDKDLQNRSLRFAAYKQFIWWIFQHLGKGNRLAIPSCVVRSIRKLFPEADGQFTRFKEGERDWLDTYAIYEKLKHYNIIYTLNRVLVKFHRCNFTLKTLIFVF